MDQRGGEHEVRSRDEGHRWGWEGREHERPWGPGVGVRPRRRGRGGVGGGGVGGLAAGAFAFQGELCGYGLGVGGGAGREGPRSPGGACRDGHMEGLEGLGGRGRTWVGWMWG